MSSRAQDRAFAAAAGHDPLLTASDVLLFSAAAGLAAVMAAAFAWAFAVRARRMRLARVLRRTLVGLLVTLVATGMTSSSLRVALATKIYDELPTPPDQVPHNTVGFRMADVAVDGRPVAVGAKIDVPRRDFYVLSGRLLGPSRDGYRFFVVSTNKSGGFVRGVQGELNPRPDGIWRVEVKISSEFCYYRYPSLFSVMVATNAAAGGLRDGIQPDERLEWFEVGHVYVHKRPTDPALRTCFHDR